MHENDTAISTQNHMDDFSDLKKWTKIDLFSIYLEECYENQQLQEKIKIHEAMIQQQSQLIELMEMVTTLYFKEKNNNPKYEYEYENVKKNEKAGFVYIAKNNFNTYYKIGKTINLKNRENTLKTSNPFIVLYAHKLTNHYSFLEKTIHKQYRKKRVAGEWFNFDENDLKNIINDYKFQLELF